MSSITNPEIILKGSIDITDNLQFVQEMISIGNLNLVIINLDEYNEQIKGENVIQGAELLPPPAAVIAEQDGDMTSYNYIYDSWYNEPAIQLFITGLITTLYRGKNILFYYPDLKDQESITIPKMFEMFWRRFGIRFGVIGVSNVYYDFKSTPVWLNLMFQYGVVGVNEYLTLYPDDARIQPREMARLVSIVRPTEQDKPKAILEYQKKLKQNPKTIRVLFDIGGN